MPSTRMPETALIAAPSMAVTDAPKHMQSEDAQKTIALMDAKIRRLQGIILRSQPQEELHLRTIQSLEQVPLLLYLCRKWPTGWVSQASCCMQSSGRLSMHTKGQRILPTRHIHVSTSSSLSHAACRSWRWPGRGLGLLWAGLAARCPGGPARTGATSGPPGPCRGCPRLSSHLRP